MMRRLACVASLGSLLSGQTVNVSVAALTPVPFQITTGNQTVSQTMPPGPLNSPWWYGVNGPVQQYSVAGIDWAVTVSETDATFRLRMSTYLPASTTAQIGLGEFLVTFTGGNAAALPVRFSIASDAPRIGPGGDFHVDVDNDGNAEWSSGLGGYAGYRADVVGQPLQFRVSFVDHATALGSTVVELVLRVTPDVGVHSLRVPADCGLYSAFDVGSPWDRSLGDVVLVAGAPTFLVLGLSAPVQLLPNALTMSWVPCFLVPAPDAVLYTDRWYLAIPQAFRPLTLHAQLVDIVPALRVSDAFLIVAL